MQIDPASLINRADRLALGRTGTLRDPARSPIDVVIDNLSETGALLRTKGSLPVGTLISLGISGLGMQMARISRVLPGAMAAEFVVPLDPQALARVATGEPLTSVAIPQLPARSDPAAPDAAVPREASPAPVVPLPVTPLPVPPSAQFPAAALTYDAAGGRAVAPTNDDGTRTIDPRLLAGIADPRRASPPVRADRTGLWLFLAGVLVVVLAMLLI